MKFIIFSDKSYNFKRPLGDGLAKTLRDMGHECEVFYDGLYWLYDLNLYKVFFMDIYRLILNIKAGKKDLYIYRWWNLIHFYNSRRKRLLKECDCIFLVENCPSSFKKQPRINYIRETYKKPVVSYDFHYLPNQGWWKYMQNGSYNGLEQFDWYLPVGMVTEFAVPKEIPPIFNCIGMDIQSEQLAPDQKEFIVLLDFPRPGHEDIRANEKRMLDDVGVKYIELNGRYTSSDIRAIYRRISAYIVSCRESFGLPIVELQLCGAKIFTPHSEWVPAHYLNRDIYVSSTGNLGSNFIVYEGEEDFKKKILELKNSFDAKANRRKFEEEYPDYFKINRAELLSFLTKIKEGIISSSSHLNYVQYDKYISIEDDYVNSDI